MDRSGVLAACHFAKPAEASHSDDAAVGSRIVIIVIVMVIVMGIGMGIVRVIVIAIVIVIVIVMVMVIVKVNTIHRRAGSIQGI